MSKRISKLREQINGHLAGIRVSPEGSEVGAWHRAEYQRLRQIQLDMYKERKPLPAAVEQARDARWRHFGAMGQVRLGLGAVEMIARLPTASDEAKQQAVTVAGQLWNLLTLLQTRKT